MSLLSVFFCFACFSDSLTSSLFLCNTIEKSVLLRVAPREERLEKHGSKASEGGETRIPFGRASFNFLGGETILFFGAGSSTTSWPLSSLFFQ